VSRTAVARAAWLALGAWGAALALRPAATVRTVCGGPPPPPVVVRVLGARQVAQSALLLLRRPSPLVTTAAAAVDGLHAASMIAAALAWPRYRRAALTSAAVAVASAVVTAGSQPR
jgi:hypothetical protein